MAVVQVHHLGNVVEANAEAFDIMHIARGYTVEFLEDMLLVGFADADAVVFDSQEEVFAVGCGADDDVGGAG